MSEVIETNPDGTEWITYNGNTTVLFQSGKDSVTQIGTDLTSPAYDFLSSLDDIGITWEIVNGVPTLTGNAKPESVAKPEIVEKPSVNNSNSSNNLINAIKESNTNSNSYMNQQNVILDNHTKLLKENNDINRQIADALHNANSINANNSAVLAASSLQSVEQLKTQNIILSAQVEATLELANAFHRLANTQSTTNIKIQESLDYAKTKSITASDGTQYSPREIEAKANAEHHLDKKGHNTMDWSAGFVDALSPLDEDLEETSLKNLLELLKTTPLEVINLFDDGKSIFKREV